MKLLFVSVALALTGCTITTGTAPAPTSGQPRQEVRTVSNTTATRNFRAVVRRVEPVAEQVCRERGNNRNCDFRIIIDPNTRLAPNAYQTLDRNGRPVIGFTQSLIAQARNQDELAFILGHEAGHHIKRHIPRSQRSAVTGAILGGLAGGIFGGDAGAEVGQRFGGTVGARRYSKEFELQADDMGTRIAHRAGYNPVRGARYFNRIPEPGNGFLASHPPNADRIAQVRRTAAKIR
ncbi:MAG: M48 family metallopeptidase [Pseudomonadota bacterium]